MIKISDTYVSSEHILTAMHAMRNPMKSWHKGDSYMDTHTDYLMANDQLAATQTVTIGNSDLGLARSLALSGGSHAKFRRMITVTCDILAPMYWWKEFDTYKIGTVRLSTSTMFTITKKPLEMSDFSTEWLHSDEHSDFGPVITSRELGYYDPEHVGDYGCEEWLEMTVALLNKCRDRYMETGDKGYWDELIQMLPSSYNQLSTVMLNYETISKMYHDRKHHRLSEWHTFCDWVTNLPYAGTFIFPTEETDA